MYPDLVINGTLPQGQTCIMPECLGVPGFEHWVAVAKVVIQPSPDDDGTELIMHPTLTIGIGVAVSAVSNFPLGVFLWRRGHRGIQFELMKPFVVGQVFLLLMEWTSLIAGHSNGDFNFTNDKGFWDSGL